MMLRWISLKLIAGTNQISGRNIHTIIRYGKVIIIFPSLNPEEKPDNTVNDAKYVEKRYDELISNIDETIIHLVIMGKHINKARDEG